MRYIYNIFISLIFIATTNAQEPDYGNIVPPNPNATTAFKAANAQSDLSTGALSLSIPLYTFSEREISIPISANYHASGLKVMDIGGDLGLGWSLSGESVITRTIIGGDDFDGGIGYLNTKGLLNVTGQTSNSNYTNLDFEPDEFTYSIPGHSGKFNLLQDGTTFYRTPSDLKIKVTGIAITITDGNGTVYRFNTPSSTLYTTEGSSGFSVPNTGITSWYLDEIELSHGHKIEFEYVDYPFQYTSSISHSYRILLDCDGPLNCPWPNAASIGRESNENIIEPDNTKLKKIKGKYSEVEFFYEERDDLNGVRLSSFQVTNKNGAIDRKFQFEQDYFITNTRGNNNNWEKRLKLLSIQELGKGTNASLPPYKFYYNEEKKLPGRLSFAADHWGYYNGENGNKSLLPIIEGDPNTNKTVFGDRSAKSEFAKLGMLNRVENPYGGYEDYDYEGNSYNYINSDSILSLNYKNHIEIFDECVGCYGNNTCGQAQNNQYIFTITHEQYINFRWKKYNTLNFGDDSGTMEIRNAKNNNLIHEFSPSIDSLIWSESLVKMEPGTYKMVMNKDGVEVCQKMNFEYKIIDYKTRIPFPLGGVRLKKITNRHGTTEYEYNDTITGLSNGIVISIPKYGSEHVTFSNCMSDINGPPICIFTCRYWTYNSSSLIDNLITNSSHVYYKNVTKKIEDKGSSEFEFSFLPDDVNTYRPFGRHTSREFGRGRVLSQTDRNEDGVVVRTIRNVYNFGENADEGSSSEIDGFKFSFSPAAPTCFPAYFIGRNYKLFSRWVRLENTYEETWAPDGNSGPLVKNTILNYSPNNKQLKTMTVSSGGNTKSTNYKYAHDLQNASLIASNIISYPLEVKVNGGEGGGYKVELKDNDAALAKRVWRFNNNGSTILALEVLNFTKDNYPKEIKRREQVLSETYLWEAGLLKEKYYGDRTWEYSYDDFRRLEDITDFNDISASFLYDDFGRLEYNIKNNSTAVEAYVYNFGTLANPVNKVTTTTTFPGDPFGTPPLVVEESYDDRGNKIAVNRKNYTDSGKDLNITYEYDYLGQLIKECDPTKAKGDCSEYTIERSPLSRVLKMHRAGYVGDQLIAHNYSVDKYENVITDEDGRTTATAIDAFGRKLSTSIASATTTYLYNSRDQVTAINPPVGPAYTYSYDNEGRLTSKTVPDYGTTSYTYWPTDQLKTTETYPSGEILSYEYDDQYNDFNEAVFLDGIPLKLYIMEGFSGRVSDSYLATFEGDQTGETLHNTYGYDDLGRVLTEGKDFGNGMSNLTYKYDNLDNLWSMTRNHTGPTGSISITKDYTYDKGLRLKSLSGEFPGSNGEIIKEQTYNDNDWLTQTILGDELQSVDYGYKPNGLLKYINEIGKEVCPPDSIDIECIGAFTSYEVIFDCLAIAAENPTDIKVNIIEYDANGNPSIATITMTLWGGASSSGGVTPYNGVTFQLNNNTPPQTIIAGILDILEDCLSNAGDLDIEGYVPVELLEQLQQFTVRVPVNKVYYAEGDLFAEELYYEAPPTGGILQKAGNISTIRWQSGFEPIQQYDYSYDAFSRLTNAAYKMDSHCSSGDYSMTASYKDVMGNLSNITRTGFKGFNVYEAPIYETIDDLNFVYSGNNKLSAVVEHESIDYGFKGESTTYGYDAQGRLKSHLEAYPNGDKKEITNIHYNFLNVPLKIESSVGDIINTYTADGEKIRSEDKTISLTKYTDVTKDFHGGIEYRNNKLEAIYHEQGRIAYYERMETDDNGEKFKCKETYNEFCLKDHLGSPRIRFADKNDDGQLEYNLQDSCKNEIFGTHHYYPFGMETEGPWYMNRAGVKDHYRYNGKEDLGTVGLLDYGARNYMPEIGRFLSVDPLAASPENISLSPYVYVANNPVRYVDPTGMTREESNVFASVHVDEDGNFIGKYDDGDTGVYEHKNGTTKEDVDKKRNGGLKPGGDGKYIAEMKDYLDHSTLYGNYFGTHYTGPNNPTTYPDENGKVKADFTTPPVDLSGYYSLIHDLEYGEVGAEGGSGLLFNTHATAADARFVKGQIKVGSAAFMRGDYRTARRAYAAGIGLGGLALTKSLGSFGLMLKYGTDR